MSDSLLKTPLDAEHRTLKARMVEFAGYEMPVQYKSILAEAQAVRQHAGMFDVSHMARLRLRGERTAEFLEWVTTNDIAALTDGQGQYTLLPNEMGGVIDDAIVYRITEEEFVLVVNASNHAKDVAFLDDYNTFGVEISDETEATAMVAVQGPKAVEILAALSTDPEAIRNGKTFAVLNTQLAEVPVFAARSGYTGEDGYEVVCAAEQAPRLWQALIEAGVEPCGLGSRDTLRVEAGLPLYGHELDDEVSPIAAGLGWVIGKQKSFLGSDRIRRAQEEGETLKLVGIRMDGRRIPPMDATVSVDGKAVGKVTSGVFSPLLGCGIGFAYVDRAIKLKTPCEVDLRGKMEPGTVVGKRFLKAAHA